LSAAAICSATLATENPSRSNGVDHFLLVVRVFSGGYTAIHDLPSRPRSVPAGELHCFIVQCYMVPPLGRGT